MTTSGPPVLVVDDDPRFRKSLLRRLRRYGYEPGEAGNGDELLDALGGDVRWRLVLLDLILPDGTGHDLLRQLRRERPELPVIAMSGHGEVDDVVHLFRAGATDYLAKPIDDAELRRRLHRVLPADSGEVPAAVAQAVPDFAAELRTGRRRLPEPPPVTGRIAEIRDDPTCSLVCVVDALKGDPGLVAAVIAASNKTALAGARRNETLRDACRSLGNRRILDLAQRLALQSALRPDDPALGAMAARSWAMAEVTASVARAAAERSGLADPDDAYLVGLLHNLGELLLLRMAADLDHDDPDEVFAAVRDQLPRSHEEVGGAAAQRWGLPRDVAAIAAAHHRRPERAESPQRTVLRATTMLGWHVARTVGEPGVTDEARAAAERLARGLRLEVEALEELIEEAAST